MVAFHFLPWIAEVLFSVVERSICQQGSRFIFDSPGKSRILTNQQYSPMFCLLWIFQESYPTSLYFFWLESKRIRRKPLSGSPATKTPENPQCGLPGWKTSRWCGPTWCRASLNWMIPWAPMLSRWKWLLGVFLFGSQMTCSFVFHFWGKILQGGKQNTEKVCRGKTRGNKKWSMNPSRTEFYLASFGMSRNCFRNSHSESASFLEVFVLDRSTRLPWVTYGVNKWSQRKCS